MTNYQQNKKNADILIKAIKDLASKPENLENLNSYLCYHFPKWLETFANTPEGLAEELKMFATMEV